MPVTGINHYLVVSRDLERSKAFYEQVIKNNKSGFKVYNCSKTGKLTFFEYKDIDDVLKNIKKYSRIS